MRILKKSVMIELDKIQKNLFVRKTLNTDWVDKIAGFLLDAVVCKEEGRKPAHEVDPIIVTPAFEELASGRLKYLEGKDTFEIAEGRHSLEGHYAVGDTKVEVQVVEFDTMAELIIFARDANLGTKLPMTEEDDRHVVRQLMKQGLSVPKIADAMHWSAKLTRVVVKDIQVQDDRVKHMQVLNDFEQKVSLEDIVTKRGVTEEEAREILAGKARKTKRKKDIANLEGTLSNKYRGISVGNAKLFKDLLLKLEDREIFLNDFNTVCDRFRKLLKKALRNIDDYEVRAKSLVNGEEEVPKKHRESA